MWMRKLLFLYILIVYVDGLSCVLRLSIFKEPCKWRFIIQILSLLPVFSFFFWQVCCVQTVFVRLGGTDTLSCLSLLRGQLHSLKKPVLWLHVGAFNRIPQSIQRHENSENAVICVPTAANMMLVQQKHTSLICSAVRAHWVQPRVTKSLLCFINFKHQVRGSLNRAGFPRRYRLVFLQWNGGSDQS